MRLLLGLITILFTVSTADGDTWRFVGKSSLPRISQAEFKAQVRAAFNDFDKLFAQGFKETSNGRIRVTVSSSGGYYQNTAYTSGSTIVFGRYVGGSGGTQLTGIHAHFIRRTMWHELMHVLMPQINFHRWQSQLRGNRVVDIGGANDFLTSYDIAMLQRFGKLTLREKYPWTNPNNPYDVDSNASVTGRDAILVINAIGKIEVDPYVKPKYFYDVNGDGAITALDATQVINNIGR